MAAKSDSPENERQIQDIDRLHLLEFILPGVIHEINNANQITLLSGEILGEICDGLQTVTDRYFKEHGEFYLAGLPYSILRGEMSSYLTKILNSTHQIQTILAEVRSFSKAIDSERSERICLNRLIEGALVLLANPIRKSTNRLEVELDPEIPEIEGCACQIQQVLLDLLRNAMCALRSKSESIRVQSRYNPKEAIVECSIEDQGYGIPAQRLAVLNEYLTGRIAGEKAIGLGFAAARSIVAAHGGTIRINSTPCKGTRVHISFPVPCRAEDA